MGSLEKTVWRIVRSEGATTVLRRRGVSRVGALLWVVPLVVGVGFVVSWLGLRVVIPTLPLALVVLMLWPLRNERLRITQDRVTWKDRLFGHRITVRPEEVRLVARPAGPEKALMLGDRRSEQLLATGAAEDVDALTHCLHDALQRARAQRS